MPSISAAFWLGTPAKYRSLINSAISGSFWASRSSASWINNTVSDWLSAATSMSFKSTRTRPPPCRTRLFCRARSIRMRRIASAAALKKCLRFCQSWFSPMSRILDERRGLKGLSAGFLGHASVRELAQFLVDEWQKFLRCLRIARFNTAQQLGDVRHGFILEPMAGNRNSELGEFTLGSAESERLFKR